MSVATLVECRHLRISKRIIEREAACIFDSYSVPGEKLQRLADSTPQSVVRDYLEMLSAVEKLAGYIEMAKR